MLTRLAPAAVVAIFMLALGGAGVPAVIAQTPATAHVRSSASRGADQALDVQIRADGVANLGGFQLILSWDSTLVKFESIENGDLLGSSGRNPYCPEPVVDTAAVRLACVTIDPAATQPDHTPIAGANGSGALATAHFRTLQPGVAPFNLSHVILVDPVGSVLPSDSTNLTYSLDQGGGTDRTMIIAIVVGAAAAFVVVVGGAAFLLRRRQSRRLMASGASVPSEARDRF